MLSLPALLPSQRTAATHLLGCSSLHVLLFLHVYMLQFHRCRGRGGGRPGGGGGEEEGVFVLLRKTTASFPLLHFTLETSPCSLLGSVPLHSSFQGFLFNSDLCSHPLLSLCGQQPRRVISSEDLEASPEGKAPQRGEPDTQAYLDLDSHSPHRVLEPHNLEAGCPWTGRPPMWPSVFGLLVVPVTFSHFHSLWTHEITPREAQPEQGQGPESRGHLSCGSRVCGLQSKFTTSNLLS